MSYDPNAPKGAITDLSGQIATREAAAVPARALGVPAPAGANNPGETVGGADGSPVMSKSYVGSVAGAFNDLAAKLPDLQAATQPDPAARRDFVVAPPSPGQPGENVGGSDGSPVTASPSNSGAGAMEPGVGTRAP